MLFRDIKTISLTRENAIGNCCAIMAEGGNVNVNHNGACYKTSTISFDSLRISVGIRLTHLPMR